MALRYGYLKYVNCGIKDSFTYGYIILCKRNYSEGEDISKKQNLYGTLGVSSSATQSEIKKAYYDLTFKYHPDRNEGSTEAATKFRQISEAYEVLGNYGMRKRYDKGMPMHLDSIKPSSRNYQEVSVKYQKFFDSRSAQQNANLKYDEMNEHLNDQRNQKKSYEMTNERNKGSDSGSQLTVTALICIMFVASIFMERK